AATLQFGNELARVFGYGVGVLAVVGLWQLRRAAARPADRFVQVFFVLFSTAVIVFTSAEGYLSSRHLVLLVVPGVGCAGVGAIALGQVGWYALIAAKGVPCDHSLRIGAETSVAFRSAKDRHFRGAKGDNATVLVVLLVGVPCLVVALDPLHAARSGYREAGQWLAAQSEPAGAVLDTLGWTALYSGRPTCQYDEAKAAFCDPRLAYVVAREEELRRPSDRARSLRHLLEVAGQPVATFSPEPNNGVPPSAVVVYRWYPERFRRLVARREGDSPIFAAAARVGGATSAAPRKLGQSPGDRRAWR
ncbi:MAG: hypothetical protein NTW96_14415, partial [Planctomycetia bacterium]|nr:hypothetical protein [Planctomycetia bacterium]